MPKGKNSQEDLFSNLSPEAKHNLDRYVELVFRIYNRLSEEEKEQMLLRLQWEKRNKRSK